MTDPLDGVYLYWQEKWDLDLTEDITQKILGLLSAYVKESSTWLDLRIYTHKSSYASHVDKTLKALFKSSLHSIEYILACLKYHMNDYTLPKFSSPADAAADDFNIYNLIRIGETYTFTYKLKLASSTFFNVIHRGDVSFHAPGLKIVSNQTFSPSISEVEPYQREIFDYVSTQQSMQGGTIAKSDHLYAILKLINEHTSVDYFSLDHEKILDKYRILGMSKAIAGQSTWKKQNLPRDRGPKHLFALKACYVHASNSNGDMKATQSDGQPINKIGINKIELFMHSRGAFGLKIDMVGERDYGLFLKHLSSQQLPSPTEKIAENQTCHQVNMYYVDAENLYYYNAVGERLTIYHSDEKDSFYPNQLEHCPNIIKSNDSAPKEVSITEKFVHEVYAKYNHLPPAWGCVRRKQYTLYLSDISQSNQNGVLDSFLKALAELDSNLSFVISDLLSEFELQWQSQKKFLNQFNLEHAMQEVIQSPSQEKYDSVWVLYKKYMKTQIANDKHDCAEKCFAKAQRYWNDGNYEKAINYIIESCKNDFIFVEDEEYVAFNCEVEMTAFNFVNRKW